MTQRHYYLSEADRRSIQEIAAFVRRERTSTEDRQNHAGPDLQEQPAPDTYIARTPLGGIPKLVRGSTSGTLSTGTLGSGDMPGTAFCEIYKIVEAHGLGTADTGTLQRVGSLLQRVWNLSDAEVPGNSWVLINRDKYGRWVLSPNLVDGFWIQLTGPQPTVATTASTGGSINDGQYWLYTTYSIHHGEMTATGPIKITCSSGGANTNTITVDGPGADLPGMNATGWNIYLATSALGPFTRQNNSPYPLPTGSSGGMQVLSSTQTGATAPQFSYSWREVTPAPTGMFTVTQDGLSGTTTVNPLYEVSDSIFAYTTAPGVPVYAWARPGYRWPTTEAGTGAQHLIGQEYLFEGGVTLPSGQFVVQVACNSGTLVVTQAQAEIYNGRLNALG